jgi:hypothetical protein
MEVTIEQKQLQGRRIRINIMKILETYLEEQE